jgi:hypothetical protein
MFDPPGKPPPAKLGFDAAVEFLPHGRQATRVTKAAQIANPKFESAVWDYLSAAHNAVARPLPRYRLFRSAMPRWGNTPQLQNLRQVFLDMRPEKSAAVAPRRFRADPGPLRSTCGIESGFG